MNVDRIAVKASLDNLANTLFAGLDQKVKNIIIPDWTGHFVGSFRTGVHVRLSY